MPILPTLIELGVLGLLSAIWLTMHFQAKRLNENQPYHLASYHRDRRQARFYFLSVWVGLVTAFLGYRCLEATSGMGFETNITRIWVVGTLRGLTMWGLLIIGAVWSQVGQRASQPNSDGKSLLPVPDEKKNRE